MVSLSGAEVEETLFEEVDDEADEEAEMEQADGNDKEEKKEEGKNTNVVVGTSPSSSSRLNYLLSIKPSGNTQSCDASRPGGASLNLLREVEGGNLNPLSRQACHGARRPCNIPEEPNRHHGCLEDVGGRIVCHIDASEHFC